MSHQRVCRSVYVRTVQMCIVTSEEGGLWSGFSISLLVMNFISISSMAISMHMHMHSAQSTQDGMWKSVRWLYVTYKIKFKSSPDMEKKRNQKLIQFRNWWLMFNWIFHCNSVLYESNWLLSMNQKIESVEILLVLNWLSFWWLSSCNVLLK